MRSVRKQPSNKRLSRDFEEVLNSGDTVVLHSGRDLSSLGEKSWEESELSLISSSSSGSVHTLPRSAAATPQKAADTTNILFESYDAADTSRHSPYKSVGTASSPDLATLIAKAKAAGSMQTPVPNDAQDVFSNPSPKPRPAITPIRTREQTYSSLSAPSPPVPPKSPRRGASNNSLRATANSLTPSLASSYVAIASASNSNIATPEKSSANRGLGFDMPLDSSDARKHSFSVSSADNASSNSVQNAMRKTSGFFKKRFGNSQTVKSPSSTSAPNTPIYSNFNSNTATSPPPPVPIIPTSYQSSQQSPPMPPPKGLSRSASEQQPSDKPREIPARTSSVPSTPQATSSPTPQATTLSTPQTASSAQTISASTTSSTINEDSRLRRELAAWQNSVDSGLLSASSHKQLFSSPDISVTSPRKPRSDSLPSQGPPQFIPPKSPKRLTMDISSITPPPISKSPSPTIDHSHHLASSSNSQLSLNDGPGIRLISAGVAEASTSDLLAGSGLDTIAEVRSRTPSVASPPPSHSNIPLLSKQSPSPFPAAGRVAHQPNLAPYESPTLQRFGSKNSMSPSMSSSSKLPSATGSTTSLSKAPRTPNLSTKQSYDFGSTGVSASDFAQEEGDLDWKAHVAAQRCWEEDETFLPKLKIAEWLGTLSDLNTRTLQCYIDLFDFKGLRLDYAFRKLCEKLYLKAETQQIDRILETLSRKYWQENPDTVWGTSDIVYGTVYALLLLNTDLHVADVPTRMSRSDFVNNTMSTLRTQVPLPRTITPTNDSSANLPATSADMVPEGSNRSRSHRSGSVGSWRGTSEGDRTATAYPNPPKLINKKSGNVVGALGSRIWENEVEQTLKDMYNTIKSVPVLQPLDTIRLSLPENSPNSPYNSWSMTRTPSRRSQAPSPGPSPISTTNRNKRASLRTFLGAAGASHDSFRALSPTPSATTASDVFSASGSSSFTVASSYLPQTMGFASSLTHTIIREQQEEDLSFDGDNDETGWFGGGISDEELALLGAPWAKEGILHKKHYWEAPNKRSKDKNWAQVFVVIQKGDLKMFQFSSSGMGGSHRMGGVGGGNWLTNAQVVGEATLVHALCSAMPPPGYNRSRPHVLVLTLSNGGTYFLQAGTEDLVNEWVSTCNYWAARLSREPLSGGVSNIEYGWNRAKAAPKSKDEEEDREDLASVRSGTSNHSRKSKASFQASLFSGGSTGGNPNDRLFIADWHPPQTPKVASSLSEDKQLIALKRYLNILLAELENHRNLKGPMTKLYSPRSQALNKALANWERKLQHLTIEHVKYTTYVEILATARREREEINSERRLKKLIESGDPTLNQSQGSQSTSINDNLISISPQFSSRKTSAASGASGFAQDLTKSIPPQFSRNNSVASAATTRSASTSLHRNPSNPVGESYDADEEDE